MNELVVLKGNDVFTDSLIISRGTGVAHRKLKEKVSKSNGAVRKTSCPTSGRKYWRKARRVLSAE